MKDALIRILRISALALASLLPFALAPPASMGATAICEEIKEEGASFTVCSFSARKTDVRVFLEDAKGELWGSFKRLADALNNDGQNLVFAMNAGMYHKDYSPVGLYIEKGSQKTKANVRRGPGNFHLLPNGVFYVGPNGAGVLDTRRYLRFKGKVDYATQSGPMLVIDGQIHSKFRAESESYKIRNGVGSCAGDKIKFAISNSPVTFHAFASLFKDRLKCRNALFLDGSISSIYAPSIKRSDGWRPMGPIVGVVEKKQKEAKR